MVRVRALLEKVCDLLHVASVSETTLLELSDATTTTHSDFEVSVLTVEVSTLGLHRFELVWAGLWCLG